MTPKTLNLDQGNRPWARPREYQRFWGKYTQSEVSGLYFANWATADQVARVNAAFVHVPPQLRKLAHEWQVTFSFADERTAAGNSATFYGDFSQRDPRQVSPHIELSKRALSARLIRAYLIHELCHLFWRSSPFDARAAYRDFLEANCYDSMEEVTEYAQGLFSEFIKERERRSQQKASVPESIWTAPWLKPQDSHQLKTWVEESFCETVAVIAEPQHPDYRPQAAQQIAARQGAIATFMGLHLP